MENIREMAQEVIHLPQNVKTKSTDLQIQDEFDVEFCDVESSSRGLKKKDSEQIIIIINILFFLLIRF